MRRLFLIGCAIFGVAIAAAPDPAPAEFCYVDATREVPELICEESKP